MTKYPTIPRTEPRSDTPSRTRPRGIRLTSPQGQVLTWGSFEFLGEITTTQGPDPSQQLEKMDAQGDPFMDLIDGKFRCVYHTEGVVYIEKPYGNGDPLTGWSDPLIGNMLGNEAEEAIPRAGLGDKNSDTPSLVAKDGLYQIHYSSKPGVLNRRYPMRPLGTVFCIQRAFSTHPGQSTLPWTKQPNHAVLEPQWFRIEPSAGSGAGSIGTKPPFAATWEREFQETPHKNLLVWNGGVLEQSVLWDPDLELYVMFYGGFSTTPYPGGQHHYRLGRAFSVDGAVWWRNPEPSPTSYVWSADDEPAGAWGSERIPHHFAVTRARDGVYHLAMLGETPGNTSSQGIGHWYSTRKGAKGSWVADPNNPLIDWNDVWPAGVMGTEVRDRLGSPNFFWDHFRNKVYLSFDGNGINKRYKPGSRIYVAVADLPHKERPKVRV